ncbi:MAG: CCA tRNA nucleotidyltransferase [archaeon]|nr:CCA tRNA nucleotidyltransferase [archaeon]
MNQKLFKEVLAKIKPTQKEMQEEQKIAHELMEKIKKIEGPHIEVILAGSMARNTHLIQDKDIDIFVLFPKHLGRQELEKESMRIAKTALKGYPIEIAYSEHPYVRSMVKGFEVEIVPSYKIDNTSERLSAVDRTPFHNAYLQEKLSEKQKDEVRLLKQFLKTIKAYGADLKTESFPGYLTELIILRYGDFASTMKAISTWKKNTIIDLEEFWTAQQAIEKFKSHLIVVDPTDKTRNVASALSFNQFNRLIVAARTFLKKPSKNFFFGKKFPILSTAKAKQLMHTKNFVAVQMQFPKILPDLVYGQMKKLCKKTENNFVSNGFLPTRIDFFTDEKKFIILIVELESKSIAEIKKHFGPEALDETNSQKFFAANKSIHSGPRIEQGRWVIERPRRFFQATKLIEDFLKKEKLSAKAAIKKALSQKYSIWEEKQLLSFFSKNKQFASWFSEYLKAREEFLDF